MIDRVLGVAVDAVALPVVAEAEQCAAERDVALQRAEFAVRVEGIGVDAVQIIVGKVDALAETERQGDVRGRLVVQLAADHLRNGVRFIAETAVVVVVALGAERAQVGIPGVVETIAALQRQRGVAIAVAIGLVGEAAGKGLGGAEPAGVDAVGLVVRSLDRVPALACRCRRRRRRHAGCCSCRCRS